MMMIIHPVQRGSLARPDKELPSMKQYFRIFGEEGDEFTRYWASISTKIENEDETEYISAPIGVRLSKDAEKVFKKNSEKTKTKGTRMCLMRSSDFWLKAVKLKNPKEDQPKTMVVMFINQAEAVEEDDE